MNKTKIFAELGYGNATFCNTEIEKGNYKHRLTKFIIPALLYYINPIPPQKLFFERVLGWYRGVSYDLIKLYFFSFKNP